MIRWIKLASLLTLMAFPLCAQMATPEPDANVPDLNFDEEYEEEHLRVILAPKYRTIFSSEINGRVELINKRSGDSFKKGDLLLKMDDKVFVALKNKAQSLYSKAEAELNAKKELYQDEISSYFELKTAEANLSSAIYDIVNSEYLIEASYFYAPYDGKVANLLAEEQEFAIEGKVLMEIIYDEILVGKALIPSNLLNQFPIGSPIRIKIPEIHRIVTGKVSSVDAMINPSSSMIKIDIEIPNQKHYLIPGMIGEVVINQTRKENPRPPPQFNLPSEVEPKQNIPPASLQQKTESKSREITLVKSVMEDAK